MTLEEKPSNFLRRQVFSNTGWVLGDRVFRFGLGLFIGIWIARYLGPKEYGVYSFVFTFVALFGPITGLGLESIVILNLIKNSFSKELILGTAFILKLFGGTTAALITVGAIVFFYPDSKPLWSLVGFAVIANLFQSFETIDFFFQSQKEFKYPILARNAAFLVATMLKFFVLWRHGSLMTLVIVAVAEGVLGGLGVLAAYRLRNYNWTRWRASFECASALIKESWPQILGGVAVMIYMRIDQVLLKAMIGDRATGLYASATRISELAILGSSAIVTSLTPFILEANNVSEELFYSRFRKLLDLMVVLVLLITIPVTIFATPIITLLYGKAYAAAGPVLAILIWSTPAIFFQNAAGVWYLKTGLLKIALVMTITGAFVNLGLNLLLIPAYGSIGSAIATVISYAVAGILMNVLFKRTRPLLRLQLESLSLVNLLKYLSRASGK